MENSTHTYTHPVRTLAIVLFILKLFALIAVIYIPPMPSDIAAANHSNLEIVLPIAFLVIDLYACFILMRGDIRGFYIFIATSSIPFIYFLISNITDLLRLSTLLICLFFFWDVFITLFILKKHPLPKAKTAD